jgi:hypothetical protein
MKVMNYHERMRKRNDPDVCPQVPLGPHTLRGETGSYLGIPIDEDRKGAEGGWHLAVLPRSRVRFQNQINLFQKKRPECKFSVRKAGKGGARRFKAPTRGREQASVGSSTSDLLSPVALRELAQKTLNRISRKPMPTAVDHLVTVFTRLTSVEIGKVSFASEVEIPGRSSREAGDPLAAARTRGRRFALEQYEDPDNLTLLDARSYAGRNERSINEERQKGDLYALLPPGKTRGFRYPKWQFDASSERLKEVLRPFVDANANCWVIHSFMMRKHDALYGKSAVDVILDDQEDVRRVVDLAERDLTGEQGAS